VDAPRVARVSDDLTSPYLEASAREDAFRRPEWFGQPRGLTILFLTDMWEQFSYFGMRALLVYYMVNHLALGQERASLTYGAYTAFAFFTPIVGGLISDRWLGARRSVIIGGCIMALGHFMMAFEPLFYFALLTIGLGNGLFLPSLPSQINGLYAHDDPRLKSAYNVYYVGVNVGGFMAPFVCGTIGELYGWHWGFTVAGVGMLIGLAIYWLGQQYLPRDTRCAAAAQGSQPHANSGDGARLPRFALLIGIACVAVVLRAGYEQVGNTVALWTERADRGIGSFTIPMTWFQSLNPLLVMLMTPWIVARWTRQAQQGREPASIHKMALGAAAIALSYLLLAMSAAVAQGHGGHFSWLWIFAFFAVMTAGELFVLPVGLGLFGRLAPRGFGGTAIAVWFLAAFAGNLVAGSVGTLWSRLTPQTFFVTTTAIAAAAAALLLVFSRSVANAESEPLQRRIVPLA
jgi:proton-dependent oligopeptide transporter, POT family